MRIKSVTAVMISEDSESSAPPLLNLDVDDEDEDELEAGGSERLCTVLELKPLAASPNISLNSSLVRRRRATDNTSSQMIEAVRRSGKSRNSSEFLQIGSLLGKGNSGTVFKALDLSERRICALKTIHIEGSRAEENRAQTMKEVDAFTALNSAHIVSFYGVIAEQESMTLVLEYMNRGSLQDALKSGPLAECYIKRIAKMGLSGLRDMHKNNMVHRDIKPGNMLCNHKGEVKIADFGIVRELGAGGNEVANTFVGTQLYMSPERIAKDSYSFAADIWSLGMTLLTLAIGEYPYKNITNKGFILLFQTLTEEPIPNLDTNIYSTGFIDFIGHCLEKDPAKRWNAEQLLEHSFLANVDITQQLKWPWDKQYLEREEASIADLANSLGESIFANRPYTHTDEDIKLFQSIGESLGMQHQEAIILLERNLPMHCWFNTTQKTNLSRRSSMKPSRTSHNRTSSGEFSAGGITSPSNSVLSEITTAMLLARKVSF